MRRFWHPTCATRCVVPWCERLTVRRRSRGVAQHHDFGVLPTPRPARQNHLTEHPRHEQIQQATRHAASSCSTHPSAKPQFTAQCVSFGTPHASTGSASKACSGSCCMVDSMPPARNTSRSSSRSESDAWNLPPYFSSGCVDARIPETLAMGTASYSLRKPSPWCAPIACQASRAPGESMRLPGRVNRASRPNGVISPTVATRKRGSFLSGGTCRPRPRDGRRARPGAVTLRP